MNDPSSTAPPRWAWRLIGLGVGLVVVVTAAGAILIGLGAADPPVAGPVSWDDRALAWAPDSPGAWFDAPPQAALPPGPFTLTVQARFADMDAAWGVWLATPDGGRVVYAISGHGYTTTRRCPPGDPPPVLDDCPALRPEWRWFAYPQIRAPGASNTITLHREPSGDIRLRLNDERMGAAPVEIGGAWGVWARGGVEWQRASLRAGG